MFDLIKVSNQFLHILDVEPEKRKIKNCSKTYFATHHVLVCVDLAAPAFSLFLFS